MRFAVIAFSLAVVWTACKKDEKAETAVPQKPTSGSPLSAEFVKFVDGKRRGIEVRLYNHGEAVARGYVVLARYSDKAGALLKVKPGTAFEKDHDFTALSGGKYQVKPHRFTTVVIDMLEVPKAADSVELAVSKVDGADNESIWQQKQWTEWPAAPAPK